MDNLPSEYTPDQARVATYISNEFGVGGGDDPIGFLIASHRVLSRRSQICGRCGHTREDHHNGFNGDSSDEPCTYYTSGGDCRCAQFEERK